MNNLSTLGKYATIRTSPMTNLANYRMALEPLRPWKWACPTSKIRRYWSVGQCRQDTKLGQASPFPITILATGFY
jgi:hypothetical protein